MRVGLKKTFLSVFCLSLLVITILQIATREVIELPERYEVERLHDADDVLRVQNTLVQKLKYFETFSHDYAIWDETYSIINTEPESGKFSEFVNLQFPGPEELYERYGLSGFLFVRSDLTLAYRLDENSSKDTADFDPTSDDLIELINLHHRIQLKSGVMSSSGFVLSDKGPVAYAATNITQRDFKGPTRGMIIAWRNFDQSFRSEIQELSATKFAIGDIPLRSEDSGRQIKSPIFSYETEELSRDPDSILSWRVSDISGRPILKNKPAGRPSTVR